MARHVLVLALAAAALAGCNQREVTPETEVQSLAVDVGSDGAPENEFGFYEAMDTGPTLYGSGTESARVAIPIVEAPATAQAAPPAGAPQIAYAYEYGFRVEADELDELQKRHVALCDAMGPECRVLSRAKSGNEAHAYGEMRLEVLAGKARQFGDKLDGATDGLDAEQISFGQAGEDLSKNITDTEARLASRRLLRERLMGVLRSRQGSVGDLVEAEQAVADVNEEIDQTTRDLATLRGRVSYSSIELSYDPELGEYSLGFLPPIRYAISTFGTTLGVTVAAIIYFAIALIPIVPFLLLLRWLWRKSGLRIRRQRTEPAADPTEP